MQHYGARLGVSTTAHPRITLAVSTPSGIASGTLAGMDTQEKIRENRARRAVTRRGYRLAKTRRRDPAAWDYGSWKITDPATGSLLLDAPSLADVEAWLNGSAR
jgi:hypothetical protein